MEGTMIAIVAGAFLAGYVLGRFGRSAPADAIPSAPPDAAALDRVRGILASEGKIAAIKAYREATGAGLRDAKLAVDTLEAPHR